MQYKRTYIPQEDIPILRQELQQSIQAADPNLEEMRIAFQYITEEPVFIHFMTIFDFLDLPKNTTPIKFALLLQPLEQNSSG